MFNTIRNFLPKIFPASESEISGPDRKKTANKAGGGDEIPRIEENALQSPYKVPEKKSLFSGYSCFVVDTGVRFADYQLNKINNEFYPLI